MKAIFNDQVIAESENIIKLEGNPYFPGDSVNMEFVKNRIEKDYTCPWKGDADYYDVIVGDESAPHSAWTYPEPKEEAKEIAGYFAFEPKIEIVE